MTTRVALVSCGKLKRDVPSPARALYLGKLFEKSLAHALKTTDPARTYIISAKYGLLGLDQVIEPYNVKLTNLPRQKRLEWGALVTRQLYSVIGYGPRDGIIEIACYASHEYRRYIEARTAGLRWKFVAPLLDWEHMPIGVRLRALNNALDVTDSTPADACHEASEDE